jgi:hypothetical protein
MTCKCALTLHLKRSTGWHNHVIRLRLSVAEIAQFFPHYIHRLRCFNSDPNRIWANPHDRDGNVITNQNSLAGLSG